MPGADQPAIIDRAMFSLLPAAAAAAIDVQTLGLKFKKNVKRLVYLMVPCTVMHSLILNVHQETSDQQYL